MMCANPAVARVVDSLINIYIYIYNFFSALCISSLFKCEGLIDFCLQVGNESGYKLELKVDL